MTIIDDLLAFVNSGHVSEGLLIARQRMSDEDLRIVAIKILSWLKSQNRVHTKRPLPLNIEYPWCSQLIDWLTVDSHLSNLFSESEGLFDFRPDVPVAQQ